MCFTCRYFGRIPLPPMQCSPAQAVLPISHGPGSKFLTRAQINLHAVQCHLDSQGSSSLIVDLVIKSAASSRIFTEVVEFGIALLEGGNQDIQKSLFTKLCSGDTSQAFFKVFYDTMYEAQQEIKSTVTVNTSDMSARIDVKESGTEKEGSGEKAGRTIKRRPGNNHVALTEEGREELDQAALSRRCGARPGSRKLGRTTLPSHPVWKTCWPRRWRRRGRGRKRSSYRGRWRLCSPYCGSYSCCARTTTAVCRTFSEIRTTKLKIIS